MEKKPYNSKTTPFSDTPNLIPVELVLWFLCVIGLKTMYIYSTVVIRSLNK